MPDLANHLTVLLYHTILCYTILCYTMPYYTILYFQLHCKSFILCFALLYYTIPYYTMLCYNILCYTAITCKMAFSLLNFRANERKVYSMWTSAKRVLAENFALLQLNFFPHFHLRFMQKYFLLSENALLVSIKDITCLIELN